MEVNLKSDLRRRRWLAGVSAGLLLTGVSAVAAASVAASSPAGASAKKQVRVAYLSFAVANSYDAPMLAAAKSVAKAQGATVTVFDAANDPTKQLAHL